MSDGRRPPGPDPASAGPEHDAWLREALRHAPDASAAPPPTLRDAILAEARAAARTATTPRAAPTVSPLGRVLAFWSWLARPQVATGFASIMAATLVGMLWWGRPMDEAMAPPASSAPVAAPAAPAVEAQKPTPPAASPEGAETMQARAQPAAPRGAAQSAGRVGPAAQPGFAAGTRRDERKDSADKLDAMPSPQMSATTPPATTTPSPQTSATTPPATTTPSLAAAPPAPFPAQTPADADSSLRRPAPARAEPFALAKKAEQPERERAASEATRPAGRLAAQNQAADVQSRQRAAAPLDGSSAAPMSALLAALAAEGLRWSRPVAGGDNVVVDAAVRTWLAQVQAAAASRWEPVADSAAQRSVVGDSPAGASSLLLHRDGRPGLVVRIDDSGVFFDPRSGPAWFASLPPEVAARLRATLPPARR